MVRGNPFIRVGKDFKKAIDEITKETDQTRAQVTNEIAKNFKKVFK